MDSMDQLQIDTPEQIALELPLAGIGSRFLALVIDTLIQFIIYFIGIIVFALVTLGSFAFNWVPPNPLAWLSSLYWFSGVLGLLRLFRNLLERTNSRKRYAGIRVIKDSGRPINAFRGDHAQPDARGR